jgi:hypothetical protein
VAPDVVALPHPRELRALDEQFADEVGEVGRIRFGRGKRAEVADADADLVVPVVEQLARGRVQEHVPADVALFRRPVVEAGEQP